MLNFSDTYRGTFAQYLLLQLNCIRMLFSWLFYTFRFALHLSNVNLKTIFAIYHKVHKLNCHYNVYN